MGNETVVLRRYQIPSIDGLEGWGVFVIGSDGFVAAVTDYGNYAFRWTHPGMEIRAFIAQADSHYLCNKLGHQRDLNVFNGRRTRKALEEYVIERRRGGWIERDEARTFYDACSHLEDFGSEAFGHWCVDNHAPFDFYDVLEHAQHDDFDAQLKALGDRLLPRLRKLLVAELEAERAAVTEVARVG